MIYILIFVVLILCELLYFKVADHYNIIDKPNERSSHKSVTLRGGGIIFFIASLLYFIWSGYSYPWFFLGLTFMALISFLDDILTLSNKIRLFIHFVAVMLMAYQLQIFDLSWYLLLISFVIIVGVINAYNFMDGINGITAAYSLSVGGLLYIVNQNLSFIDQDIILFNLLGVLVFAFFNFRDQAKCFAGDVGSVSIAFILLFLLGSLIIATGNIIYILFLSVYGVDSVLTILRRLYLKENIFEAHRSHLYQYLANEAGVNKLLVSSIYATLQFLIGFLVIFINYKPVDNQIVVSFVLLSLLSVVYLLIKNYVFKKYVKL